MLNTCRTCPHRPETAGRVYLLWGEIPVRGENVLEQLGEQHACHNTLDNNGDETLDSWPCSGYAAKAAETEEET